MTRSLRRRVPVPARTAPLPPELGFTPSAHRSVGVELELQVVDPVTFDLISLGPRLLEAAGADDWLASRAHKELMQNTVEIVTGMDAAGRPHRTVRETMADMEESIARLGAIAAEHGGRLVSSGSHPFANPADQRITEDERILRMVAAMGKPVADLQTYGLHVHVGVPDGDAAIRAQNHLNRYLAHFLALSGSSPFWNGEDTGQQSWRSPMFETMALTGPPPPMRRWKDYVRQFVELTRHGRIADGGAADPWAGNKDIHWDVRPSPKYGTIELRIADATPTLREAAALAALAQCLVEESVRSPRAVRAMPDFWVRENKQRAVENGLDAGVYVPGVDGPVDLVDDIRSTVARLQPIAKDLDCSDELNGILEVVERGPSAQRQRAVYAGSLERQETLFDLPVPVTGRTLHRNGARAVVASLADELGASVAQRHFARAVAQREGGGLVA